MKPPVLEEVHQIAWRVSPQWGKKEELPKPVSPAELMSQLSQDPNFVQRRKAKERHLGVVQIALQVAEEPIVNALRSVGIRVDSVWDLVNQRYTEPRIIPILVEQLRLPYPYRIREGIARGLTVQNAGKRLSGCSLTNSRRSLIRRMRLNMVGFG
jgi:hypothetical protein